MLNFNQLEFLTLSFSQAQHFNFSSIITILSPSPSKFIILVFTYSISHKIVTFSHNWITFSCINNSSIVWLNPQWLVIFPWIVYVLCICVYRDTYVLKKFITFKQKIEKRTNPTIIKPMVVFSFGLVWF